MAYKTCPNCEVIPLERDDLPPFIIQCDECRRRGQESGTTDADWEWGLPGGDEMEAPLEAMIAERASQESQPQPSQVHAPSTSRLQQRGDSVATGFEADSRRRFRASGAGVIGHGRSLIPNLTGSRQGFEDPCLFTNISNTRNPPDLLDIRGSRQPTEVQRQERTQPRLSLQEHRLRAYGVPDAASTSSTSNGTNNQGLLAPGLWRSGLQAGSEQRQPAGLSSQSMLSRGSSAMPLPADSVTAKPRGYTTPSVLGAPRVNPNPQFRNYGADQEPYPFFSRSFHQLPSAGPTPPQLMNNGPVTSGNGTNSSSLPPPRSSAPTNPPQPANNNASQSQEQAGRNLAQAQRSGRRMGRRGRRNEELHSQGLCIWCRRPNPDLSRKGCPACLPGRAAYTARYRQNRQAARQQGSGAGTGAGQSAATGEGNNQGGEEEEEEEEEEGDEEVE